MQPEFRDLNGNGVLDPYEDARLSIDERVEDLLARLSLDEKVGLMFHTVIESGLDGTLVEGKGAISKSATTDVVLGKHLSHFNVHELGTAPMAARWMNALQRLAERSPHGIPVTISTDPRHGYVTNAGASFAAGMFSQWPEPLGLAALHDPSRVREFAEIARAEYVAVGIRAALHPTLDLATEPRWARQVSTFGQDPARVTELAVQYLLGFQGDRVGPGSVACTSKHFPGGGPQMDGEDAHFPYGREQVYPAGRYADHVAPFAPVIDAGTSGVMPYYGMPIGLEVDGVAIDEVGFGFNRQIVTDLLRGTYGFDGVVLSDWELITDNHVGDQVLPARAWGVEHLDVDGRMAMLLDAGVDQFGGEECVEVLRRLVDSGRVPESRLDESARRLLRVKFELGLFDDPFVSESGAAEVVGSSAFVAAGRLAQSESVTVLRASERVPLAEGARVYVEGMERSACEAAGLTVVERPEDADVAVLRLEAPFDPRSDLFLEAWFHAGSLDFPPGLVERVKRIAAHCPVVLDVTLDRPAILTPWLDVVDALTVGYGTSDAAYLDVLTGRVTPIGRLPFDIPRSMQDVREHPEDQPGFDDPLFPAGHRVDLSSSVSS
ncbi:glycoside hydrolase family 3 protein [Agrococcus jejuensis]|uniref:beta-glucosidase n=1 Tax=Agrococcus jejuensis TaxID=399736 RepID=A0A1G8BD32_9MICO|nr:glycoside hydrolase family 3 N-terminal domain-containing protein [Agrococcus jejuensis]SDH31152.1 beta-glucosidase [Agrococcus jejuensis]